MLYILMSKKIMPLGLKLIMTFMILLALVAFVRGLSTPPGGVIVGIVLFIVSLIFVYAINQREQIVRISLKIYFIFLILATLYNIKFVGHKFTALTVIQILSYFVVILYVGEDEIKEFFKPEEKKIRYKMEEIRREEY